MLSQKEPVKGKCSGVAGILDCFLALYHCTQCALCLNYTLLPLTNQLERSYSSFKVQSICHLFQETSVVSRVGLSIL